MESSRRSPKTAKGRIVEAHDDGRIAVDVGENGFARSLPPFVASVERVLASLPLLEAGEGTHQVVRIGIVERWPVCHHVDLPALQHRQRLGARNAAESDRAFPA